MKSIRRCGIALVSALVVGLGATTAGVAQTTGERGSNVGGPGAAHLVLEYKSTPQKIVAFRTYMERTGVNRFKAWKKEGIFANYKILFARDSLKRLPDMYIILDFKHFSDIGGWQDIEKTVPAGLDSDGLGLAEPTSAIYSDIPWSKHGNNADTRKSVYMLIPYTVLTATDKYEDFVSKYILPQTDGWLKSGILNSYEIHLNQNPLQASWDSLLVFEYNGMDGVALRDIVKQKVRSEIKDTPGYKEYSPIKTTIREEHQPGLYDDISR